MDFSLQLITNSPAVIEAAAGSFGRFGPAEPTSAPDFRLYLFESAPAEEWSRIEDTQRELWLKLTKNQLRPKPIKINNGSNQPVFQQEGPLVYQTLARQATLVVDRRQGVACGFFSRSILANQSFFRWHFLELAFFVMLEAKGLMGVHGAALVRENRALLLRAASGGGKTTLAYAGARHKFQALAEDVVWLDLNRQVWWGMPWWFHLLPDAKNLFPELAAYEPVLQTNGELKLEVDLEEVRAGSTIASARPGPVILVQRHPGGQSRLEPLALSEASRLWLAGSAGLETNFPNYQQHIETLLKDNAFQLYVGDDLVTSLELLETLIN